MNFPYGLKLRCRHWPWIGNWFHRFDHRNSPTGWPNRWVLAVGPFVICRRETRSLEEIREAIEDGEEP